MEELIVGAVVTLPFPFADFSSYKTRPALVIGYAEFDNLILCQITSKSYTSKTAIRLTSDEFASGDLELISYIRPDKIFTVESSLITGSVGKLNNTKLKKVKSSVQSLFD